MSKLWVANDHEIAVLLYDAICDPSEQKDCPNQDGAYNCQTCEYCRAQQVVCKHLGQRWLKTRRNKIAHPDDACPTDCGA